MNAEHEKDARYTSSKCSMDISAYMRQTLSKLERSTHKFVQEHNDLSSKVEYLKFKSYAEERNHLRSGSDPRYYSNGVGMELRSTLSQLQKATHNFVREHDVLTARAEYLRHRDFFEQREKHLNGKNEK